MPVRRLGRAQTSRPVQRGQLGGQRFSARIAFGARPLRRNSGRAKSASGRPVSAPLDWAGARNSRTFSSTGKSPAQRAIACRSSSTQRTGLCGSPGTRIDEAFRVTDPSQAVLILRLKACGRLCLNSTLKSLLFWMVLVVVGVLIWNFSTKFQTARAARRPSASSCRAVDAGNVARVTITGQDITGVHQGQRTDLPHLRARRSTTAWSTS